MWIIGESGEQIQLWTLVSHRRPALWSSSGVASEPSGAICFWFEQGGNIDVQEYKVLISWIYVCKWPCVRHTLIQKVWNFHFLRSWQGLCLQLPWNPQAGPQPGDSKTTLFINYIYIMWSWGAFIYIIYIAIYFLLRFKPEPLLMVFGSCRLSLQYENPPSQAPAGKGCGICEWPCRTARTNTALTWPNHSDHLQSIEVSSNCLWSRCSSSSRSI